MARIFDVGIDFGIDGDIQCLSSADSVIVCHSCAFNMRLRDAVEGCAGIEQSNQGGNRCATALIQVCGRRLSERSPLESRRSKVKKRASLWESPTRPKAATRPTAGGPIQNDCSKPLWFGTGLADDCIMSAWFRLVDLVRPSFLQYLKRALD